MQYSSDFTVMKPVIYILLTGEDEEWTEIMKNQKVFQLVWIDKRERYIAQRIFFYAYITRYNKLDTSLAKRVKDNVICFARNLIKDVQRRKIKYENNDETVNS